MFGANLIFEFVWLTPFNVEECMSPRIDLCLDLHTQRPCGWWLKFNHHSSSLTSAFKYRIFFAYPWSPRESHLKCFSRHPFPRQSIQGRKLFSLATALRISIIELLANHVGMQKLWKLNQVSNVPELSPGQAPEQKILTECLVLVTYLISLLVKISKES